MARFKTVCKLVVEGVSLLTLVLLCLAIWLCEKKGVSFKRGFFCDDDSIRYPYKRGTIPTYALVIISCSLPVIIAVCGSITEIRSHFREEMSHRKRFFAIIKSSWFIRSLNLLKWYLCGIVITLIVTSAGKMVVGRLRPHFLDVCKPNFTLVECSDTTGYPIYVTDYQCFGDQKSLADARLSWPSGHASISAYACVFLAVYLFSLRILPSILRTLLILISLMISLLTGLSRVSDYKHHPTDVLSGLLLGLIVATGIVISNLGLFRLQKNEGCDTNTTKMLESQERDILVK